MSSYIDENYWRNALSRPDWYRLIKKDFDSLEQIASQDASYYKSKQIKGQAYSLVENAVKHGQLPIAAAGEDLDVERKPIDTIVVHYTKNPPGMTLSRLNAMHLLRPYGQSLDDQAGGEVADTQGRAVWSGHFYKRQQVFWAYHWLIRADGKSERILDDNYIGWHAGNWEVNTRSVAICIDDDLSDKMPSDVVIESIAELIRQHYPMIDKTRILGHCEVNTSTACPGRLFMEVWKQKLLDQYTAQ